MTTLGDVAQSIRNGLFAKRPTDEPLGTPVLRISAVRDGRVAMADRKYVAGLTSDEVAKFSLTEDDLLITRYNGSRRLVGICARVGRHAGPVIHPDKLIRVSVDREYANPQFVNLQMQSPGVRTFLEPRIRTTAGQSGISGRDVRAVPLWLPPLPEQQRIVDILDDHLSRLDVGRSAMRISRARLAALRVARLRSWHEHAVAAGGAPTALGDVVDTALGKMLDAKANRGRSTPYLRNVNVRWGTVDLQDVQTVPLTDAEQDRFSLAHGDLLVCEGGEPGRCAIWQSHEPMAYQKALHRLRVRDGAVTTGPYVALMLEEFVRSGRAEKLFTGTTIKHLPQERLRTIRIPLPRLEVQQQLIEEAALFRSDVERFEAALATTQHREAALRRALFDAAFSGSL